MSWQMTAPSLQLQPTKDIPTHAGLPTSPTFGGEQEGKLGFVALIVELLNLWVG